VKCFQTMIRKPGNADTFKECDKDRSMGIGPT
jgi:hypothetical protein